ncbi:MAG: hypothetical protein JXX14_14760 [Deltaproteobacteria bacterium]|nr:hypothetical protein [Deltaproteobacteria bacterium]
MTSLLLAMTFQISCSGCSEDESGKSAITDTENLLTDTMRSTAGDTADSVDTDYLDTHIDLDTFVDTGDEMHDSADRDTRSGAGVGVITGGAQLQSHRYQLRVSVGAGVAASGQSKNYQLNVGVGAQTTR